jgi:KipI family sensor histidine kinase inhibitor
MAGRASRSRGAKARVLAAGDRAIVVELGDRIDPRLSARVLALDRCLAERPFEGFVETIPTYRSLLVVFDPDATSASVVRDRMLALVRRSSTLEPTSSPVKEVPTVYDGDDLVEVAEESGLAPEEVVRLHSGREYLVYMVGFTPGFAYMGRTDPKIAIGRKATPRARVPAGSVAIAKGQTGIYPSATPGGWHIVGRAEYRGLFDPKSATPSFFSPGDRVRFVPVSRLPRWVGAAPSEGEGHGDPVVEVEDGGLLTTVQDRGRFGYGRFGVPAAGAVDSLAYETANRLVGNEPGAAALECTVSGPRLRALRTVFVAVTGGDLGATVEREDLGLWRPPPWSSFLLRPENVLRFDGRRRGARSYIAFAGGIDVPLVMGSRSTYLASCFGGLEGRSLQAGDRLRLASEPRPPGPQRAPVRPPEAGETVLRVIWGPQDDAFTQAGRETLVTSAFRVSETADRMGYRLTGPALAHRGAKEIVSDGMMAGAIQVPPDGLPIVMLADCATTGGYPKIATVVSADLRKLGQLIPGERLRFQPQKMR